MLKAWIADSLPFARALLLNDVRPLRLQTVNVNTILLNCRTSTARDSNTRARARPSDTGTQARHRTGTVR